MAVVYVSSNKLADFLGISVNELKEIEEYFDRIPDDQWELKEGRDYRIVNKRSGLREYTQSGAHTILSFLRFQEEQSHKSSGDIKIWFNQERRKKQKALVDHKILQNSSSLIKRQDQFWLSVRDVVKILGTRDDFFRKLVEITRKQGKLIRDIHYTFFNNDNTAYISLSGIYELANAMGQIIKQNHRKEWCQDVGERITPQINAIVKEIQGRQKQIEKAKDMAKKRDRNICKVTQRAASSLAVHHLYSEAHYPKLAANLDNLITIADEVHNHFHQWMGGFSQPCTIDHFTQYVLEHYPENTSLILWLDQQKETLGQQLPVGAGKEHVLFIPLKRVMENN